MRASRLMCLPFGVVMLTVASQIEVPMVPVPMTLQSLVVLVLGAWLGPRWGPMTVLGWLGLAAVGAPVLAEFKSGIEPFAGPTGGYLLGFLVAAAGIGEVAQRGWMNHPTRTFAAMLGGHVVILTLGVVGLLWFMPLADAVSVGVVPFLIGAAAKSLLGTLLYSGLSGITRRSPGTK